MSIFDKFKRKLKKPAPKKDDAERAKFAAVGAAAPEEKVGTPAKKAAVGKVHGLGDIDKVLLGPVVTEKATDLRKRNQFVFEVSAHSNKSQIKKAFAVYYGVTPLSVNSIHIPGKKVRFGRTSGTTKVRKKVIITLPKGRSIEI